MNPLKTGTLKCRRHHHHPTSLNYRPIITPIPTPCFASSAIRWLRHPTLPPLRGLLSASIIGRTKISSFSTMGGVKAVSPTEPPSNEEPKVEDEYTSLSKLLLDFVNISNIDKGWVFPSGTGKDSKAMFSLSQPNLLANKKRNFLLSAIIPKTGSSEAAFQWSPFPVELSGVSIMVPSPSGSKVLIVRNPENDSPTKIEIWTPSDCEKEFQIPQSVHGSVYVDGWFEGVSWNSDETLVAYVAEEPSPSKPTFNSSGYNSGGTADKDCNNWKGQGDWVEGWGETYANKRWPNLFVINVHSGEVRTSKSISSSLTIGQVVWAPATEVSRQHLVFVGWSSPTRKLGIKYCYNRSCALYAVPNPFCEVQDGESTKRSNELEDSYLVNLTEATSSACFPRFSPDGKILVFLSTKSSVDSGAHCATDSLHRLDWPSDGKPAQSLKIIDVVPVVTCAKDDGFPGLYAPSFLVNPFLSDGRTVILSSMWRSSQVILSVDVLTGNVSCITPRDSDNSWNLLSLDEDNIIAVSSSLIHVPQLSYGSLVKDSAVGASWRWQVVEGPIYRCSEKVRSLLSSLQFSVLKIPVRDVAQNTTAGARQPYEAILVSSNSKKASSDPLIVVLHGGPHSVSSTAFSKSLAFLASTGFSLLIVNYRGSLGYGEEALQSLPGKVGTQDVNDVLAAVDHVVEMKLADPSKITVLGGSHGGFLSTHLIGQAPEKFVAAAVRNPVCNLALMVGTTDIPDWCFFETYGNEGLSSFTEAPSKDHLGVFYEKSPVSHLHKVKTPTLFLLGAQDLRVPVSNGLQYARTLREKEVEVKVIVFPEDEHAISRPQSDFESFLNIAAWFKKYIK
ncbi:hypothetical protein Drorol1_Dr00000852 [Drosera rotundifolia]